MKKQFLILEFSSLFLALPIVLYFLRTKLMHMVIPLLLVSFVLIMIYLVRNNYMSKTIFFRINNFNKAVKNILIRLLIGGSMLIALQYFTDRGGMFSLPRHNTFLWAMIMVLYPLLSVIPQEIIYRVFIFHRYKALIPRPVVYLFMSGAAFSFVHILFGNITAPLFTLVGGVLFSLTYLRTNSVLMSSLEHALWGDLIFTIGMGKYFYSGAIQ